MTKLRLLAAAAMAVGGALLVAPLAYATPGPHPVVSTCNAGWYTNEDEGALLPVQVEAGFLFDGPSLVHRALAAPVLLAAAPLDGAFTAEVQTGVAPLFKMETSGPYSTINKTGAGTYWSSKIASGPGSQAAPVASIADLAALAPYTATTTIYSFGVGYANDAGNKALVKTVTFGGNTYELKCVAAPSSSSVAPSASASSTSKPPSSPPASASVTPTSTVPGTATAGASASASIGVVPPGSPGGSTGGLPLTGVAAALVATGGAALVLLGAAMLLFLRYRNREPEFVAE